MTDFNIQPIGHVENAIDERQDMKATGIPAAILIYDQYLPALSHLQENSHVIVQCLFHKSKRDTLKVIPRKFGIYYQVEKGVFATRSPDRPNPISITVSKLIEVKDNKVIIDHIDAINGTPVVDIKPYSIGSDSIYNTQSLNVKTDFINPKDETLYEYIKSGVLNYIYEPDNSLELGIYSILKLIRNLHKMPDREIVELVETDYSGSALDTIYYYLKFTPGEGKIKQKEDLSSSNSFLKVHLNDGNTWILLPDKCTQNINLEKIAIKKL